MIDDKPKLTQVISKESVQLRKTVQLRLTRRKKLDGTPRHDDNQCGNDMNGSSSINDDIIKKWEHHHCRQQQHPQEVLIK